MGNWLNMDEHTLNSKVNWISIFLGFWHENVGRSPFTHIPYVGLLETQQTTSKSEPDPEQWKLHPVFVKLRDPQFLWNPDWNDREPWWVLDFATRSCEAGASTENPSLRVPRIRSPWFYLKRFIQTPDKTSTNEMNVVMVQKKIVMVVRISLQPDCLGRDTKKICEKGVHFLSILEREALNLFFYSILDPYLRF